MHAGFKLFSIAVYFYVVQVLSFFFRQDFWIIVTIKTLNKRNTEKLHYFPFEYEKRQRNNFFSTFLPYIISIIHRLSSLLYNTPKHIRWERETFAQNRHENIFFSYKKIFPFFIPHIFLNETFPPTAIFVFSLSHFSPTLKLFFRFLPSLNLSFTKGKFLHQKPFVNWIIKIFSSDRTYIFSAKNAAPKISRQRWSEKLSSYLHLRVLYPKKRFFPSVKTLQLIHTNFFLRLSQFSPKFSTFYSHYLDLSQIFPFSGV